MAAKEYFRGATVRCTATITTVANVAANPSVSTLIRITDPQGTRVVADVAMTSTATGSYEYLYDTTSSSLIGEHFWEVVATDGAGSDVTIQDGSFVLRERRG